MSAAKKIECCSECGRPLNLSIPRRICYTCKKQITRHHKWTFGTDGRVRHRNCKDPQSYR